MYHSLIAHVTTGPTATWTPAPEAGWAKAAHLPHLMVTPAQSTGIVIAAILVAIVLLIVAGLRRSPSNR
jgi:hypothetical protein